MSQPVENPMLYRYLIVTLVLLTGCHDSSQSPLAGFVKEKEEDAKVAIEQLAPGMLEVMHKSRQLHFGWGPRSSPNHDYSIFVHELVQSTPAIPENLAWKVKSAIDNESVQRLERYLKEHHIRISPRGTISRFTKESGGKSIVIEHWKVPEGRFLLTEVMIMQP